MPPIEPPTEPVSALEDPHLRDSGEMVAYHLQAQDGELGHVNDLVLDDQDWSIRYFVVDTRTWWQGKTVPSKFPHHSRPRPGPGPRIGLGCFSFGFLL